MEIRDEIIRLVRDSDIHGLTECISSHLHQPEFQALLNNESLFTDLFSLYAEQIDHPNSYQKTLLAIQLLIGHGLKKPERFFLDPYKENADKYCHLSNSFHNSLSIDYCMKFAGFWYLDTPLFNHYLDHAKSHPVLKQKTRMIDALTEYRSYLMDLDKHQRQGTLLSFFERQTSDDDLKPSQDVIAGTHTHLYPCLGECSCLGHERKIRRHLEDELIKQATSRYLPASTESLHYLSLGSGELLQDFILILKLLKAGYKNLSISLIEPSFNPLHHRHFEILHRLAKEMGAKLNISHYVSVEQYMEQTQNQPADLISSIDFENIFKSEVFSTVMRTQSLLADHGFFLFSYDQFKLGMTKDSAYPLAGLNNTEILDHFLPQLSKESFLEKEQLTLSFLGQQCTFEQWLFVLPLLKHSHLKTLTVYLEPPCQQSYFSVPQLDKPNNGFDEQSLAKWFSLLLQKPVTVHFIKHSLADDWRQNVDLVTSFSVDTELERLYQSIHGIVAQFNQASCYIGAQYATKYDFLIPVAKGHRDSWLTPKQVQQRVKTLDDLHLAMGPVLAKVDKIRASIAKPNRLDFFSRQKKALASLDNAVERARNDLIQSFSNRQLDVVSGVNNFIFKRVNNQASIYETLETAQHRKALKQLTQFSNLSPAAEEKAEGTITPRQSISRLEFEAILSRYESTSVMGKLSGYYLLSCFISPFRSRAIQELNQLSGDEISKEEIKTAISKGYWHGKARLSLFEYNTTRVKKRTSTDDVIEQLSHYFDAA